MNILFRCDGSVEIGMGHVVRCLALADHLRENYECKIHFAMRQSGLGINKVKEIYPVLQSNENEFQYGEWLADCLEKTNSKILILDMRDCLNREELKSLKKKTGIKVVTIDDPEDKRLEADLAFYPPVPQLEKTNWAGFAGELYIGWEFVILRKEFAHLYPKPNNQTPNIFVSMGGTDEKDIISFVIDALNEIKERFNVNIVIGSGYPYIDQLNKKMKEINFRFTLYKNPRNIAAIMAQCDFAIISYGQTAFELAAMGTPSIYLCLTDDHFESSRLFVNEGIGTSLGVYSEGKKQELIQAAQLFITERHVVEKMSDRTSLLNKSNLIAMSSLIIG